MHNSVLDVPMGLTAISMKMSLMALFLADFGLIVPNKTIKIESFETVAYSILLRRATPFGDESCCPLVQALTIKLLSVK